MAFIYTDSYICTIGMKGSRLNSSRIKRFPLVDDASKTESETIEHMKNQRFSDEQIKILQKKLDDWKQEHEL